jgi:uncharacterized membrane protein YgcG
MADKAEQSFQKKLRDLNSSSKEKVKEVRRWIQHHPEHSKIVHRSLQKYARSEPCKDTDKQLALVYVINDFLLRYADRDDKAISPGDVKRWIETVEHMLVAFSEGRAGQHVSYKEKVVKILRRWGDKSVFGRETVQRWIRLFESGKKDVIDDAAQRQRIQILRYTGCNFIKKVADLLKLKCNVQSSAYVYFHNFFKMEDFADHNRFVVALSCILLAAKAEDSPRKLEKIVEKAFEVQKTHKVSYSIKFGPTAQDNPQIEQVCAKVVQTELTLLHCIAWDVQVDHPHCLLISYSRKFVTDSETAKKLARHAWNLVNDSLHTDLCLEYGPKQIACTALMMGTKIMNVQLSAGWNDQCDMKLETLAAIEGPIKNFGNWQRKASNNTGGSQQQMMLQRQHQEQRARAAAGAATAAGGRTANGGGGSSKSNVAFGSGGASGGGGGGGGGLYNRKRKGSSDEGQHQQQRAKPKVGHR